MEQQKATYYISIANGEISKVKTASPWDYRIEATDDEIIKLREYFDQGYSSDWQGFFRAHIPYVEYHHDKANDGYDESMQKAFALIYELGDEQAKEHIKSMGIISSIGHGGELNS
ncbi:hydrolase [Bacillus sp. PS06]|uniref:hydrolase n=1 Tax=Bacillus sp. PS06 TaxID=2764176 RepID=UPI001787498F|nr:hydrolase [Bacillus sp. PS06]MBD8068570.1 hydrolase [Bacillus sp. PS06]